MQIINMSSPGLYVVNTATNSFIIYIAMREYCEGEVFKNLCRAIVRLEREGRIITSVQKLYPDGHRPRVSFRKTAEYKQAKEEQNDKIISASYVTYWDSGTISRIPCKVNLATREVFDIDFASQHNEDAKCILEYVRISDTEIPLYNIDTLIRVHAEWVPEKLKTLKSKERYWYSLSGNKLV